MKRILCGALVLAACGGAPPPIKPVTPPVVTPPVTPTPVEAPEARQIPEAPPEAPPPTPPTLRLPDGVKPVRYAVDLTIVPSAIDFTGSVDIQLAIEKPTRVIWVEAFQIEVTDAGVLANGKAIAVKTLTTTDFIGFELPQDLEPGSARLHIVYKGKLPDGAVTGLFRVKDGGETYVFSKFESFFARRAFPCWDEPGYKVPWQLTLHVKKEHTAFSNTPMVSEADEAGGMKVVKFAETKPLPSYLVALAVGPLEAVDAGKAGAAGVPIRIIVPKGHAPEAAYVAEIAAPILDRLEKYFDIPYPYAKLDLVAVPQQPGAMENAALITVNSRYMLADPVKESIDQRRRAAHLFAHEMAHMWFGDLVTTAWWDDIWLNEAFASWMDLKTIAAWQPTWKTETTRIDARSKALAADALRSARQIRQPIATADDIINSFDSITYDKGASVLSMTERWLGPEVFRRGVKAYLTAHAYGNATSAEFFAAMTQAAGHDVAGVMSSYTDQPGVPEIGVSMVCARNATPKLVLGVHRYLPGDGGAGEPAHWQVPLCAKYPAGHGVEMKCMLVSPLGGELALDKASGCPAWVLANADEAGYYHTIYEGDLLPRLLKNFDRLNFGEKLGLVDDLIHLLQGGRVAASDVLALVPTLLADKEPLVASSGVGIVDQIANVFVDGADRPAWQRFVTKTLGPRAHALGWKATPHEDDDVRILRPGLLAAAAIEGHDDKLRREAAELTRKWLDDRGSIDAEIRSAVTVVAAYDGDRILFDRILAEAGKEKDADARSILIRALVKFRNPDLLLRGLRVLISSDVNPREAVAAFFGAATKDPALEPIVFAFIRDNFDALVERYPPNYAPGIINVIHFCDDDHKKEVESFFTDARAGRIPGGPRTLAQKLEAVDVCAAARAVEAPLVKKFLGR